MMRARWTLAIVALFIVGVAAGPVAADWKPTKPITTIVPWPAGGATDLTVRILASEMEKVLGQRISVVNTPGATGSIGMKNAYDAPRDGYTWTANSDTSLVNYPVLDLMKTTHRDWVQWYALLTPCIISVRARKLKPLANTSNHTLNVSGFGEVPPVTKWYPAFPVTGSHFGLMVPKDVPKDVVAAISKAFDVAAKSDALKKFAEEKAVFLTNLKEAEALAMAEETASVVTWTLFDNGAAKISPAQFNIPKPKK